MAASSRFACTRVSPHWSCTRRSSGRSRACCSSSAGSVVGTRALSVQRCHIPNARATADSPTAILHARLLRILPAFVAALSSIFVYAQRTATPRRLLPAALRHLVHVLLDDIIR